MLFSTLVLSFVWAKQSELSEQPSLSKAAAAERGEALLISIWILAHGVKIPGNTVKPGLETKISYRSRQELSGSFSPHGDQKGTLNFILLGILFLILHIY